MHFKMPSKYLIMTVFYYLNTMLNTQHVLNILLKVHCVSKKACDAIYLSIIRILIVSLLAISI